MELLIAKTLQGTTVSIQSQLANRHGLIAGATGTGKTVTLQTLAEQFSKNGVPVFMADVKGDLSGISQAGTVTNKLQERLDLLKITDYTPLAVPTMFWDVYGQMGHPVRATITEIGPTLLARLMNLNDTQTSVLQILFKMADDAKLPLLDTKDLSALLQTAQENIDKLKKQYGQMAPASLGAIQRGLLNLEERGSKAFFGEPALNIDDLLQTDSNGHGYVSVLSADKLLQSPVVYSTFLLWLLSELFEVLPEVGDLEKPKLVFFFDEAHLLFKETPKILLEKIEQVVRLIRSKGVGVYFITQNPLDIPESVLAQLSHRVQHALRAFTPMDQKAVKVAAQTLRQNPNFSAEEVITQLGVGEVLISVLDSKGMPTIVERAFVIPPNSRIGPITPEERKKIRDTSPTNGYYEKEIDRESAYEILQKQRIDNAPEIEKAENKSPSEREEQSAISEILFGTVGPRGGRKAGMIEKVATSTARSVASSVGREIVRGLLGSLMGGGRGSRRR